MSVAVFAHFSPESDPAANPEPRMGAAKPRTGVARVRTMTADDLEPVADLFLARFRNGSQNMGRREEIAACMKALYLDHPTRTGDADALVATDSAGAIAAFCGAMRTRFQFDDSPAAVCVTGTLMASPAPEHALAAVQILRESRKLDYDLIVTDSANRTSLAMCQAMGYQVASPDSLEWACVFEPTTAALYKLRQRYRHPWLGALKPLARVADMAAAGALRAGASNGQKKSEWRDEEVDAETFVEIAPGFLSQFRLRPMFSRQEFLWMIEMARQRQSAGPLRLHVIKNGAGEACAAYAAFGGVGDVAQVIHAAAAPHAWGRMFEMIVETARNRRCIGARGSLKPSMIAHAYAMRGVFFYYAGGMLTFSRRPEIRSAIERGEAFLGGFAGDRWTRLATDNFS